MIRKLIWGPDAVSDTVRDSGRRARGGELTELPDVAGTAAPDGISVRLTASGDYLDRRDFMDVPLTRTGPEARRIVYVGELSPRGGVAEFLASTISWADGNPDVAVEILWLGEGDLLGVMQAQPAPPNLIQTFAGFPPANKLAHIFARCGLMVVPSLSDLPDCWIIEAMAAGLPVLGSIHNSRVRALVARNKSGWLFDPLRDEEISAALEAALTASPARLNAMRAAANARIKTLHNETSRATTNRMARKKRKPSVAYNAPA